MMTRFFPLLCLLLAAACGTASRSAGQGPEAVLSVVGASHAPGDTVTLVLENRGEGAVGYNLCSSTLERRTAGGWEAVPSEQVCTRELRILEPGARASFRHPLPPGAGPGEYRYRTGLEVPVDGGHTEAVSEPFRVS